MQPNPEVANPFALMTAPELVFAAIERSEFFLHGSGPATLGWAHAQAFVRRTGRGFGVGPPQPHEHETSRTEVTA